MKRWLSLFLVAVMLFGVMVVGASATFTDADELVNKEAIEIVTGLGLFAGFDGTFDPEGTVTRAQMAAVVARMFYGSDLNADTYRGGNKFIDISGSWAEGYINLGVEKGWIERDNGIKFQPDKTVTTVEAVAMILNLLGCDVGEGIWPFNVMTMAEDIGLFDLACDLDPVPKAYGTLTYEQLAVIVWNALNYSADGVAYYKVLGCNITFHSWADAAAYADTAYGEWDASFVTEIRNDTRAEMVFGIPSCVTANQKDYTGVNDAYLSTGIAMIIKGLQICMFTFVLGAAWH